MASATSTSRDFDHLNPPLSVTDPRHPGGTTPRHDRFPWHVHARDGSYVSARDDDHKAALEAAGYRDHPWTPTELKAAADADDAKAKAAKK